jgi:hypothetical protein
MLSSFRTDALALMKEKCGGPYTIVREGETKDELALSARYQAQRKPYRSAGGAFSFSVSEVCTFRKPNSGGSTMLAF